MPVRNVSTSGLTFAQAQAACEAALLAAGIPTAPEIESACEDAIIAQAGINIPSVAQLQAGLATASALADVQAAVDVIPDPTDVQAAAQAAIDASVGAEIPTAAQNQFGLATTVDVQTVGLAVQAVADGAQGACQAALNASVGGAIPSLIQIESECNDALIAYGTSKTSELQPAAQAAITASIGTALVTAAQVQTAASASITAAVGVAIPTVVQNQAGLATAVNLAAVKTVVDVGSTATAVAAVQTTVNALPSAAAIATAVGAQAACAAAITAANGVAIPSVSQNQVACEDAIDGRGVALTTDVTAVPAAVQVLAVGSFQAHQTVTISGAGTSGTLIAAAGLGLRTYITGILVSCTVGNSTMQLVSTGGQSTGVHSILLGDNLSMVMPFGIVARSGSNTAVTCNKTAAQTLIFDVWYYQGA